MIAGRAELERFKANLIHPLPPSQASKVIEALFTFDLPVTASEIWPYLIDTSKMNFELGFPPRQEREVRGETHVTTVTLGRKEEWIEKPWIWVHEKEIQQYRIFLKGWMSRHRGIFRIDEINAGSTRVSVYFRWGFKNIFNYFLFKAVPGALEKSFAKFMKDKTALILEERKQNNKTVVQKISQSDPYEAMRGYFLSADPLDLDRIHVKEISHRLGLDLQESVKACIRMVKAGELSLSWDVICPHCRGARSENASIAGLTEAASCEPCGASFGIDAEESVEVVFHLTPKLREIQKVVYCGAEPAKKKHIKLYQEIGAGITKTYQMHLPAGTYRLRRKNSTDAIHLELDENETESSFAWTGSSLPRKKISNRFELILLNSSADKDSFTLEEAWWFKDRMLSGEALSNPSIREIFSEDHLQTGLKLNVGNQVILFTDIVGSTPLYKNLGDALSLKAVQSHYKEVSDLILKHNGVVVKYIGDAVMAAFLDLEKAMLCSVEIHQKFSPDRKDTPIRLRASFHEGKVLCANMNVGLDYFGNTVNQAAKIQKYANAHEIAVTEEDWKRLEKNFSHVTVKPVIHDPKLNLDVRILTVS